ncbi:MAG: Ig-like domain-containing protein [Pirellulales bacterium]|nr:Ig-like domain-containing protein [Pirellulales bacterium]
MSDSPENFDFAQIGKRRARGKRHRTSPLKRLLAVGAGIFVVALIAGLAIAVYSRVAPAARLTRVGNQEIDELKTLKLSVAAAGVSDAGWFDLVQGPEGAELDRQSAEFKWTPTEAQGPGLFNVVVRLVDYDTELPIDQIQFSVSVLEVDRPPVFDPVAEKSIDPTTPLYLVVDASDPDQPAKPVRFDLTSAPEGATINQSTGAIHWDPVGAEPGLVSFIVTATEGAYGGLSATKEVQVRINAPPPGTVLATDDSAAMMTEESTESSAAEKKPEKPLPTAEKEIPVPPAPEGPDTTNERILAIYEKNKLFQPNEYPALRKVFADQFERRQWTDLHRGFGADYDAMDQWFKGEPEAREELFTAIDPEHDDAQTALKLFKELKKNRPEAFPSYLELAIALAVTWDNDKGVYDYTRHQERSGSTMPDKLAGPIDGFRYFIENEKVMQGRAQLLPWEILCYVVDHRTPLPERPWVLQNYLSKRAMIGQCYSDVPYDAEMRVEESGGKSRIKGKPYTLENLRKYGGIYEMQADFAARVAKCLGVPAAYVSGPSVSGQPHAWVTWVEFAGLTRSSISFSVQSFGRSRNDYFVGKLTEPNTGAEITDRDMELRLQTVGLNSKAKRQAALVMRAFPIIRDTLKMDAAGQLAYLNQVVRLCPGNEAAWLAIAQMSREKKIDAGQHKAMMASLESLYRTFANFPDFTCRVFDDMIAFQDNPKQREKLYERMVALYGTAGRPDLGCEAILKYVDYLVSEKHEKEAIQWLAVSIQRMPGEGRYVPRMLDRLESLAKDVEGSQEQLVRFYQEFLPKIPQMEGNAPSPYCIEMFERAIKRFKKAGRDELAQAGEAQLVLIKAGRGQRSR